MLITLSRTDAWPHGGWMMMGDELSVCAGAEAACFVQSSEVSFNDVVRTLKFPKNKLTHCI